MKGDRIMDFAKIWEMLDKLFRAIWAYLTKEPDEGEGDAA